MKIVQSKESERLDSIHMKLNECKSFNQKQVLDYYYIPSITKKSFTQECELRYIFPTYTQQSNFKKQHNAKEKFFSHS